VNESRGQVTAVQAVVLEGRDVVVGIGDGLQVASQVVAVLRELGQRVLH
jgi:hypothetical protein